MDWRRRNSVTEQESARIGQLLCDNDARDLALRIIRDEAGLLDCLPVGAGWVIHSLADGNVMAQVTFRGVITEAIADSPRSALMAAVQRLGVLPVRGTRPLGIGRYGTGGL